MKTKIIYISGNEIFAPADVRAAFDEVRAALNLGPDTVLFGVPVEEECEMREAKSEKREAKSVKKVKPAPESAHQKEIPILSVLSAKAEPEIDVVEMITDDAPEIATEKTLEELLENMRPLDPDTPPICAVIETGTTSDTDETLSKLAAEFAAVQSVTDDDDEPPVRAKPTTNGKISKLKNILPFKKSKNGDAGLMGDLFGWAGIAANDDEFSVPGFFSNAAK